MLTLLLILVCGRSNVVSLRRHLRIAFDARRSSSPNLIGQAREWAGLLGEISPRNDAAALNAGTRWPYGAGEVTSCSKGTADVIREAVSRQSVNVVRMPGRGGERRRQLHEL